MPSASVTGSGAAAGCRSTRRCSRRSRSTSRARRAKEWRWSMKRRAQGGKGVHRLMNDVDFQGAISQGTGDPGKVRRVSSSSGRSSIGGGSMIERVRLENFKAFREMDLPLGPLTLLSGVNAAGKSTTMQAWRCCASPTTRGARPQGRAAAQRGTRRVGRRAGRPARELRRRDATEAGSSSVAATIKATESAWRVEYRTTEDREADLLKVPQAERPSELLQPPEQSGLFGARIPIPAGRPDRAGRDLSEVVRDGGAQRFLGVRGEHTVNYLRARHEDRVASPELRHPAAKSAA